MPFTDRPSSAKRRDDRSKDEQYYEKLQTIATDKGLLDEGMDAAKVVGSGIWDTLVDIALREEAMMVGIVDAFRGDENRLGARLVREAIGGTKVGNFLGVGKNSRKAWAELFEDKTFMPFLSDQGLSEVWGENQLTRFIDPSIRGAAALGASIFLSPSTYMSMGANGVMKFAGKAGTIVASPRAEKMARAVYEMEVKAAAAMNRIPVPKNLKSTDPEWLKLEHAIHIAESERLGWRALGEQGAEVARLQMVQNAQQRVADFALAATKRGTDAGLDAGRSIRFGDTSLIPFAPNFKGFKIVDLDVLANAAGKPGKYLMKAMREGKASAGLAKHVDGAVDFLDKTFKRVPRAIRSNGLFKVIEERRHALISGSDQIVGRHMKSIKEPIRKIGRGVWEKDKEFRDLWRRAADNEQYLPQYFDYVATKYGVEAVEFAHESLNRWHAIARDFGSSAVKLNLLRGEQIAKYGNSYFPHNLKLDEAQIDEIYSRTGRGREFTGGDVRPHEMDRVFKNFDELEEGLLEAGLTPEEIAKVIDTDIDKILQNYMETNIRAIAGVNFANDILANLVPTVGNVLTKLDGEIGEVNRLRAVFNNADGDDLAKLNEAKQLVQSAISGKKITAEMKATGKLKGKAADIAKKTAGLNEETREALRESVQALKGVDEELVAGLVYEMAWGMKDMRDLSALIELMAPVIRAGKKGETPLLKTDLQVLNQVRSSTVHAGRIFRDADVTTHTFRSGVMEGTEVLVPKPVAEFFRANEKQLRQGLTPESKGILKAYDILTNTFKSTHTVIAPAFHARNAISNVAAMGATIGIDSVMNPVRTKRVLDIIDGKGDWTIVANNGVSFTRSQLSALFDAMDVAPNRALQQELTGQARTITSKIPVAKQVEEFGGKIGARVENIARGQYVLALLESGVDPATAARKMKEVLFDYGDLSEVEREGFKRIFPFFTWTRKTVELQLKNLATRPGGTVNQIRLLNNGERGPEADLLPEFMRGEMKIQLRGDKPGGARFITNIDMPINNIDVLWAGGMKETFAKQFGMINPVVKNPLEWLLSVDTFTGKSTKKRKWLGEIGPFLDETLPGPFKEYLELRKVRFKDGSVGYDMNGTKWWVASRSILTGRLLNEVIKGTNAVNGFYREVGDGDQVRGMLHVAEFFSGMRLTDIDLDQQQQQKLKAEIRRLEAFLLEKGHAAEFRRVWFPDS
jgi:hypothetical protein